MIAVINMKYKKDIIKDYNFDSSVKMIKFVEKNIKFSKNYGYSPALQIFVERLNNKVKIPIFIIGRNKIECIIGQYQMLCNPIECDGFWLNYEKHSYKDIIFHVIIHLENSEIERKIIDFKHKMLIDEN
jgi:hypothetical protein